MATNRRKYWNSEQIDRVNAIWNFIIGGRNLGKSYCIKVHKGLEKAWKEKKPTFMLIRRYDLECKPSHIENYFQDAPVETITNGEYNVITAKGGTIYFSNYDFDTGKTKQGIACGKYVSLAGSIHIKSEAFPFITDIINEEICATDYLSNEVELLLHLVSTIARDRVVKVWCIGNTVNRMNPYTNYFGVDFRKLKQGQVTLYNFKSNAIDEDGNPKIVKVAVEYCSSEGAENGMFFGHVASSINEGAFECGVHPRLQYPKETYTSIFECLLKDQGFAFVLQLLANDETGKLILYAYPYSNGIKQYERVLSKDYSEDPFKTVWFNRDDECEQIICQLLDEQQIAFSDNLTGDEFIQVLKVLKSSTL